jgi:hypothetical protein
MGKGGKSVTVGYKYFLGMHAVLCQSPVDALLQLDFGDRTAWAGTAKNRRISINRDNLFGGKAREGGVSGFIDVEGGEPTQEQNTYLASKLPGGNVPNFRGVMSLVFRRFYFGNNPYIKPFRAKVRNVFSTFGNFEKNLAALNVEFSTEPLAVYIALDNSGSMLTGGKGATAITAINILLDRIPNSDKNSVAFVRWGGAVDLYAEEIGWDNTARSTLKSLVSATPYNGSATDFAVAFDNAGDFFDDVDNAIDVNPSNPAQTNPAASGGSAVGSSSGNDRIRRIIVFVTDGEPTRVGGDPAQTITDEAVADLAAIDAVEVFTFNIDLEDTTYTEQLDSSGETTVIDAGQENEMADAITANASSFADLNAAHIARDILVNPLLNGSGDENDIGTSFATAAQTLYDEGFGLSIQWSNINDMDSIKRMIESHIDARIYFDTATGKWEIKLIRPDYTVGDLFTFDNTVITEWVQEPETPKTFELTNQITLEYTRRDNGKSTAVTLTNIAGVLASGRIINEKVEMPGITWGPLANKVAQRELQSRSSPITRGAFRAAYVPTTVNLGSAIIVNEPRVGLVNRVCRVTEIEEGDLRDNSVIVRFATDVFALDPVQPSFAVEDVAPAPDYTALPPDVTVAFEAPFYQLLLDIGESDLLADLASEPDLGFWLAGCDNPGENHIQSQISINNGGTYFFVNSAPFAPAFALTSPLSGLATDDTFTALETGEEAQVEVGDLLLIGDELVRVDSIVITGGVATFTIGRGCLDTVPRPHGVGTYAVAWQNSTLGDAVQYVAGEAIEVKVSTQTPTESYPLSLLAAQTITFDSRAIRPYPVGQLMVDSSYDPGLVGSSVTATWVHRDRLQQTTGTVEDHTSATIGPESGVSYLPLGRVMFMHADVFESGVTDFFARRDFFVDEDTFVEVEFDDLSPDDDTTYTFDLTVLDPYVDEETLAFDLGVKTLRGTSPVYENWQTPFVRVQPLLAPIFLEGEDITGAASPSPSPSPSSSPETAGTGFHAVLGTDRSVSPSAFLTVALDTVDDDTGGFDTSLGYFVVPASLNGKWARFVGGVRHNSGASGFGVYISNSTGSKAQNLTGNVNSSAYSYGLVQLGPVELVTGDIWTLGFFNTTGGIVLASPETFLAMEVLD